MGKKFILLLFTFTAISMAEAQIFNKAARELKNANELIEKKKYDDALKSLAVALDLSKGKEDYEIFYRMGFCHYQLGNYDKALEQLNHAVSKVNAKEVLPLKTSNSVQLALLYRAKTFETQKNYVAAIKDLQLLASVQDNPTHKSLALLKWAEDLYAIDPQKNQDAAEVLTNKSIETDKDNSAAYAFAGKLDMNEKDYENAIKMFSLAVATVEKKSAVATEVTDKASYTSLLALATHKNGKIDEAKNLFQKAVDAAPESTKWKIYQYQADLIIKNKAYHPDLISLAEQNAAKAAILLETCETKFTLAYTKVLANKLTEAATLAKDLNCNNSLLNMSASTLKLWVNDLSNAKQIEKLKVYGPQSGWYYMGGFTGGLANGKGKALSKNHLYEVENGVFVKGTLVSGTLKNLHEGWEYSGAFLNGTLSGTGKKSVDNGDVFSGKFVANKLNGQGKCFYADGSTYEGLLTDNKPNGIGTFKEKSGSIYQGSFKDGLPHGAGILTVNGVKENVKFTNGERTDAVYLARLEKAKKEKIQRQELAAKQLEQEQLAKAQKRANFGKILGKSLTLAGGAVALKQASDLGMNSNDVTQLGTALLADVLTDNKDNNFANTLALKNASGAVANNSILGGFANNPEFSSFLGASSATANSTAGNGSVASGVYVNSNGNVKINVSQKDKGLYITYIKPTASDNHYTLVSGNLYTYTSKYGVYYLQALPNNQLKTFKKGYENNSDILSLTENTSNTGPNDGYLQMAEMYKNKMQTDPNDAQAWAFCAMAAHAKTTHTEPGYTEHVTKIAASLKQIVPSGECPCIQAIPKKIWDSVK
ncbi:Tetratricopeptide repeat protein [compost metagenome]